MSVGRKEDTHTASMKKGRHTNSQQCPQEERKAHHKQSAKLAGTRKMKKEPRSMLLVPDKLDGCCQRLGGLQHRVSPACPRCPARQQATITTVCCLLATITTVRHLLATITTVPLFAGHDHNGVTFAGHDHNGATFAGHDHNGATSSGRDHNGATLADHDHNGATFAGRDHNGATIAGKPKNLGAEKRAAFQRHQVRNLSHNQNTSRSTTSAICHCSWRQACFTGSFYSRD